MSLTRAEVVAYLEGLGAHELGELIDALQARLGLPSPAAPQWVTMGAPPTTMGMPEEATEYAVVLTGFTSVRRIHVLKALRELRTMPLKDAILLLGELPATFARDLPRREAEELAAKLREAGAEVELR